LNKEAKRTPFCIYPSICVLFCTLYCSKSLWTEVDVLGNMR